jgi:protein-S-isoprenylcysteine O-methyltransferase Ste14
MTAGPPPQTQTPQQDPAWVVRLGGVLFAWRTSLPLPIVLALLLTPPPAFGWGIVAVGTLLVATGELIRLWAVRQIGAVSRTRSDRLGPLVSTGPFAYVRNPLYLGNIALWAGFAFAAGLVWMAPIIVFVLACVYHAIVRWEETLLEARLGESYRAYAARVARWIPSFASQSRDRHSASEQAQFSWRDTLFSERGTLIAIGVGSLLLLLKTMF